MKSYLFILVVFMVSVLSSCGFDGNSQDSGSGAGIGLSKGNIEPVAMTSYTKSDYMVHFKKEGYVLGRLEPGSGCYLGSYVLANGIINYDMHKFDELTGKRHALSVYNMKLGEEFPYEWVLECIAGMKTPYIIIRPPNDYSVFQEDRLETAAKEFGSISMPIFVDFYPDPGSYTRNHEAYVSFYRKAREMFAEHAPSVVFVLSVDSRNVYDFSLYYPGDQYTDWIGIIMYQPLYIKGTVNLRNYMKDLDYLYQSFQHEKPIIVSQLAISSYSTTDHRYASRESAMKLLDFYDKLKNDYQRIKGVVYMDFNNVTGAPKNAERDNFSVTQDEVMRKAYTEAVSDEWFISETLDESEVKVGTKTETFKSNFIVLEDENFKYVSQTALRAYDLEPNDAAKIVINGEIFYSTEELLKSNKIECIIDDANKRLIICEAK